MFRTKNVKLSYVQDQFWPYSQFIIVIAGKAVGDSIGDLPGIK